MDDIDRGKIGKKDEKLVGWDYIRKPKMNTNYPPMKARGKDDTYYSRQSTSEDNNGLFVVIILVVIILIFAALMMMQ